MSFVLRKNMVLTSKDGNSRLSLYEELDHGIDGKDKEKVLEEIGRFIGSNDRKNC